MRARMIAGAAAGLVIAAGLGLWLMRSGTDEASPFTSETVTVGAVEVRIEPHHIDDTGATVKLTLDTHTTELDMPLSAILAVDGVDWPGGTWIGDPPSGHHRAGEFRFQAAGNSAGTARFTLAGLPEPVSASWMLGTRR